MTTTRYTHQGRRFTVTERTRTHVRGRFDGQAYLCTFSAEYFAREFTADDTPRLFDIDEVAA